MSRSSDDLEPALRALARLLAPYIAEELGAVQDAASSIVGSLWTDEKIDEYVASLTPDVAARAVSFFALIREKPLSSKRLDQLEEDDPRGPWLGEADARHVAGLITTPLTRKAAALDLPAPFERISRRGETVWRDSLQLAERLESALESRLKTHTQRLDSNAKRAGVDAGPPDDERPGPMGVLVLRPQYSSGLEDGELCWLSTLRDMRRGDRAVIYQSQEARGIVGLFDVSDDHTEWNNKWGWGAEGRVHVLDEELPREELLQDPDLKRVFERPQGRRYLPPRAQRALVPMLKRRLPGGELPRLRA